MLSSWRTLSAVVLIFVFGILIGCSGRKKWEDLPADVAWVKIKHYYDKKKYLDAIDHLEIFLINHAGASMVDSAQFLLAESHYKMKEYIISASEYEKLTQQYPQSELVDDAEYMLGMSYYRLSPKYSLDQTYTEQAVNAFQLFIEDFPQSDSVSAATQMILTCREKLARKDYENGHLYQKVKEYEAARIYYDSVLDNYYDTSFAPLALYRNAEMRAATHQWPEAVEEYTNFLDKFPDHELSERALKGLNHALKMIRNSNGEAADSGAAK